MFLFQQEASGTYAPFLQGGSEKSQIGGSPGGPDDEFPPSSQEPVAVVAPFGPSKWVTCPARFMSVSFSRPGLLVCISIKHTALQGDGQQIGYLPQLHGAFAPAFVALQLQSGRCTERPLIGNPSEQENVELHSPQVKFESGIISIAGPSPDHGGGRRQR